MKRSLLAAGIVVFLLTPAAQAELVYSLGATTSFDGTAYLQENYNAAHSLTSPSDGLTISATFDIAEAQDKWIRLIGRGGTIERNYGLWYRTDLNMVLYQHYAIPPLGSSSVLSSYSVSFALPELQLNQQYNLTGLLDDENVELYLDGVFLGQRAHFDDEIFSDMRGISVGGVAASTDPGYVDEGNSGIFNISHGIHSGNIYAASLWNETLDIVDVTALMDDQVTLNANTLNNISDVSVPNTLSGLVLLGMFGVYRKIKKT